jgi:hypothetical protein
MRLHFNYWDNLEFANEKSSLETAYIWVQVWRLEPARSTTTHQAVMVQIQKLESVQTKREKVQSEDCIYLDPCQRLEPNRFHLPLQASSIPALMSG